MVLFATIEKYIRIELLEKFTTFYISLGLYPICSVTNENSGVEGKGLNGN